MAQASACMKKLRPSRGWTTARVSLMLNVENSVEKEDKEWKNTKDVRRLKPGEKNITKLTGIGDEAWFDGNVEKGKVAIGGILARKGKADFALAIRSTSVSIVTGEDERDRPPHCRPTAINLPLG